MAEPKERSEMLADFLREAAVLFVVFGPLDYLVSAQFTVLWFGVIVMGSLGIGLLLLWSGIRIEEKRKK